MIKCWLFGHKPLLLKVLDEKALMTVNDSYYDFNNKIRQTPLINIHMCKRCKYTYWESAI